MAKFYFHSRNANEFIEDDWGVDLPDLEAARKEAMRAAREIIAEQLLNNRAIPDEVFESVDADGTILAYLPLKAAIRMEE
jgi:hypothetical protein